MSLLQFDSVSIDYGDQPLLDHANCLIRKGDRICLIGRNGEGKSTLMKLAAGLIVPDGGQIRRSSNLQIGFLGQSLPAADGKKVYDVVAEGLDRTGQLLAQWQTLADTIAAGSPTLEQDMVRLQNVQQEIENRDGWKLQQRVEQTLERLQLPAGKMMSELSGGWRRRVELAKALVCDPDILLLDEPTNHLDVVTIDWLEKQLLEFRGALLFITHDRAFLKSLATTIIELDRGNLTTWSCNYTTFLQRKAHALEVEQEHNARFDKKLAQEEGWIRQGIKARRTRNEGRVRALQALRQERLQRRTVQGRAKFQLEQAVQSGKLVTELTNVSFGYPDAAVVEQLDFTLLRGDKVGLIGGNGAGKTTLLNILLGHLAPQRGSVRHGTKLEVAYFDQMRETLDDEKTVIDNVAQGREKIMIDGRERHVISYLEDFLFAPARARVPVKTLSGGEKNRLLLATLFSKPANVLVLDEPTNDLDVETLELLESILVSFSGTVLLVSHDRDFLDNVVASTLVFEGLGKIREYVGGFADWIRQGGSLDALSADKKQAPEPERTDVPKKSAPPPSQTAPKQKFSFKQQRELQELPDEIDALEREQASLEQKVCANDFYQQQHEDIQKVLTRAAEVTELLEKKIERWSELEQMRE